MIKKNPGMRNVLVAFVLAAGLAAGGCTWFGGPEAVIAVDVLQGVVPLTVTVDGSASSPEDAVVRYRWDPGTGDPVFLGRQSTYTYEHTGTYVLTLTVETDDGRQASSQVTIEVQAAVWVADTSLDQVFKLDLDGNVITSFSVPTSEPTGVTLAEVDGRNWLFVACQGEGNQRIFRLDPESGAVMDEVRAPANSPLFLSYGQVEPKRVWHVDGLSRKIYALNRTSLQPFASFGTNYFQLGDSPFLWDPQGLDWTGVTNTAGVLWYVEGETRMLYEITIVPRSDILAGLQLDLVEEGSSLDPALFPIAGIDWFDGMLWVVRHDHHQIVEVDPATGQMTGETIDGFPGADVSGLEFQL
ncbi:PKD domain-containing protein [Candidatus Bipolaricaulota bacterium]|nr:PKD domain-containing protein [Candidatus Bipolaricaulota bacterium]